MKISLVSDVHIKDSNDDIYKIFLQKISSNEFLSSQRIMFLGDIFDLMSGQHDQYLDEYKDFFKIIADYLKNSGEVYYFEGNHDVHLKKLLEKAWGKSNRVKVLKNPIREKILENEIYFSHGDELDYRDKIYQNYKKFINLRPLELFADYVMPYFVLKKIGQKASELSRRSGKKQFDYIKVRDKFRNYASKIERSDLIICGHTHIEDDYNFVSNEGKESKYFNLGYFPRDKKCFILNIEGKNNFKLSTI